MKSVCYDKCGWGQYCDSSPKAVWTTSLIKDGKLYKNVALTARVYGYVNYLWTDNIKWDTRNAMCEAVMQTVNDAQIIGSTWQYGCNPSCGS